MAKRFRLCESCIHRDRLMDQGPLPCALCGNPAGDYYRPMNPKEWPKGHPNAPQEKEWPKGHPYAPQEKEG